MVSLPASEVRRPAQECASTHCKLTPPQQVDKLYMLHDHPLHSFSSLRLQTKKKTLKAMFNKIPSCLVLLLLNKKITICNWKGGNFNYKQAVFIAVRSCIPEIMTRSELKIKKGITFRFLHATKPVWLFFISRVEASYLPKQRHLVHVS